MRFLKKNHESKNVTVLFYVKLWILTCVFPPFILQMIGFINGNEQNFADFCFNFLFVFFVGLFASFPTIVILYFCNLYWIKRKIHLILISAAGVIISFLIAGFRIFISLSDFAIMMVYILTISVLILLLKSKNITEIS